MREVVDDHSPPDLGRREREEERGKGV